MFLLPKQNIGLLSSTEHSDSVASLFLMPLISWQRSAVPKKMLVPPFYRALIVLL